MIKILNDEESEMIRIIDAEGKVVFEGNHWDFDRTGWDFGDLFGSLGLEVELEEKPYEEWYD